MVGVDDKFLSPTGSTSPLPINNLPLPTFPETLPSSEVAFMLWVVMLLVSNTPL